MTSDFAHLINSKLRSMLISISFCVLLQTVLHQESYAASKPNIVLIYSDDVGFGDIGCQGAKGIVTPHIDTLAQQGIRFTNAHASASVCSPSRYAILTGHYAWRAPALASAILDWNARLTIDVKRPTIASILKSAGYAATAIIGKWHLGLGTGSGTIDYNKELAPGPNELGFDYSFVYPATNDRVPSVWIKDHWMVNADPNDPITTGVQGSEPTAQTNPELLIYPPSVGHSGTILFELGNKGISRIGFMNGGKKARWTDETMVDTMVAQAVRFMEDPKNRPFFLVFMSPNIHVPRYPNARVRGTSACGYRGDAMHELDWSVGQIMATLKRLNISDSTLVIFSSDNGPVLDDGYADSAVQKANAAGHKIAGNLRGTKTTLYEGGVRVPFIVRWPGMIPAGSVTDVLVGQTDLLATFAAITGQAIPGGFVIDSRSMLPTLLSGGKDTVRSSFVVQQNGSTNLAIISGDWKLILTSGAADQLYNLRTDLAESKNVASSNASVVTQLKTLLNTIKNQGPTGVNNAGVTGNRQRNETFCVAAHGRTMKVQREMLDADASITVFDSAGRIIYRSEKPVSTIRCEHGGLYFVTVKSQIGVRIQKVLIR